MCMVKTNDGRKFGRGGDFAKSMDAHDCHDFSVGSEGLDLLPEWKYRARKPYAPEKSLF